MTIRTDRSTTSNLRSALDVLARHPRRVQALLDVAFAMTALAAFGQVWDPDVLFHVIWVILTIEAFLFGLRGTVIRTIVAIFLLLLYFNLGTLRGPGGPTLALLDLAEWPLMVVIVAIIAVMAERVATTSRRYAELYRQASDRLVTAQEDERKRLGRDLHDGVGQTLTAVVLTLDAAEAQLWAGPGQPSELGRGALARAQELAALALDETRDVAYRLRPDRFVETGLVAATNRLATSAGVPVTVIAAPALNVPGLLEPEDEMNVYRIIQEAMSNAIRHSRARHVRVEFGSDGESLSVAVVDDGIGFRPAAVEGKGLGFAGMRERAMIVRGTFDVSTKPRAGTRVTLSVPLRRNDRPTQATIFAPTASVSP